MRSWGGPGQGYDWPTANHGIFIDHLGNVWIGNGPGDSHLVKFTRDGKFLQQFAPERASWPAQRAGAATYVGGSNDQQNFGRIAKIFVDPKANEAFLADGYLNKRVAVIDAMSGKMKRTGARPATNRTTRRCPPTTRRRRRQTVPQSGPLRDAVQRRIAIRV